MCDIQAYLAIATMYMYMVAMSCHVLNNVLTGLTWEHTYIHTYTHKLTVSVSTDTRGSTSSNSIFCGEYDRPFGGETIRGSTSSSRVGISP